MRSQSRNMPEEEHSIKVRSNELYFEETALPAKNTRPFAEYLRKTPAKPIAAWLRALFAVVGLVVGVLFFLALWKVSQHHPPARRPAPRSADGPTAMAGITIGPRAT